LYDYFIFNGNEKTMLLLTSVALDSMDAAGRTSKRSSKMLWTRKKICALLLPWLISQLSINLKEDH